MACSTRRQFLAVSGLAGFGTLAGCLSDDTNTDEWETDGTLSVPATQYHDPNCGCCGEYADYLESHLAGEHTVVETSDPASVKQERGIPRDLYSCHTIDIDDYVVEGHVPVEVIEQLLEDRPDATGIALPAMPRGTPGMPGDKDETWTFTAFTETGETWTFTEL